jgi:hypothetical protein
MNREDGEKYAIEEFEDPAFNPVEVVLPKSVEQPITQESLDLRIKQTKASDLTDTTVSTHRIAICNPCEFNKPLMGFGKCSECNCFTYLKSKIKSSACPKGKW